MGKNTGSKRTIRPHVIEAVGAHEVWNRRESKPTGGKKTLRGDLIERRGSSEAWYGGDNPRREATPCFGTQPHCLQVQLARHCLLANEASASVAPSEVCCRSRDLIEGGCPSR